MSAAKDVLNTTVFFSKLRIRPGTGNSPGQLSYQLTGYLQGAANVHDDEKRVELHLDHDGKVQKLEGSLLEKHSDLHEDIGKEAWKIISPIGEKVLDLFAGFGIKVRAARTWTCELKEFDMVMSFKLSLEIEKKVEYTHQIEVKKPT